jgi:hypothetical protein
MSTPWWKRHFGGTSPGPDEADYRGLENRLSGRPAPKPPAKPDEEAAAARTRELRESVSRSKRGSNRFRVFFSDASIGLDEAIGAIEDAGLSVTNEHDTLRAADSSGLVFHIDLLDDELAEVRQIGKEHGMLDELRGCGRQFQVYFENLDAVLDETNALIELQTALQDLTAGYVLLDWNDELLPPE